MDFVFHAVLGATIARGFTGDNALAGAIFAAGTGRFDFTGALLSLSMRPGAFFGIIFFFAFRVPAFFFEVTTVETLPFKVAFPVVWLETEPLKPRPLVRGFIGVS